jgi:hypothetical protein
MKEKFDDLFLHLHKQGMHLPALKSLLWLLEKNALSNKATGTIITLFIKEPLVIAPQYRNFTRC